MTKLLEKYTCLSDQAEGINTYDAYKELIDTIRELSYKELYGIMRDSETALEVLVRGETNCNLAGIDVLVEKIVELGELYIHQRKISPRDTALPQYTYEWLDKRKS